jgi:hypothetical protein
VQVALQAAPRLVGRAQQLHPRAAQRLLGLDPVADVAQVADEDRWAVDVEPRDRELDWNERPVGALRGDLDALVEDVRLAAGKQPRQPLRCASRIVGGISTSAISRPRASSSEMWNTRSAAGLIPTIRPS